MSRVARIELRGLRVWPGYAPLPGLPGCKHWEAFVTFDHKERPCQGVFSGPNTFLESVIQAIAAKFNVSTEQVEQALLDSPSPPA